MSIVSIHQTHDYSPETVKIAVERHFEALGIADDLRPDMNVLIKPNLVTPRDPNTATTTHPQLVLAVVNWLREHGINNIIIADSPGGLYTAPALRTIYNICGYKQLSTVAELNYDVSWQTVQCPSDFKNRSFNIITPITKADYIINMPKLKTHGMMTLSGAVKNMFGAIPGIQKPEMHYRWTEKADFARMLVELTQVTKPNVTIVDSVEAMEGNGPNSGNKKYTGVTFASKNPFTLDSVMAEFMGLGDIEMLQIYREMGLIDPPKLVGDTLPEIGGFKLPDSSSLDFTSKVPGFLRKPVKKVFDVFLHPLPKVNTDKCIGCGKCAESCPPQIIKVQNRKAHFTQKGCISCFCCQEMCPVHAISIKRMIKW